MTTLDFSQSDDETLADELPEGWVRSQLGAVAWPSKNKIEPSQQPDAPYLGLEHIESHTTKVLGHGRASDVKSTKAVFHAGDVLYGKLRPYLNKVCVPDFAGVCSTDFLVFDQKPWLDSRFLLWSLLRREVVEYANHHSTGVELPRISYDALASLDFWLPPLTEQNRIVARIEQLMARTNVLRQRISGVPAILKRFRQAVLTVACSGRLTEDWRNKHPDTEPAEHALARCKEEKLRDPNGHRVRKRGTGGMPDVQTVSDLPATWTVRTIKELVEAGAIVDFQDGNHGELYPRKTDFGDSGVTFLTATQVFNNRVLMSEAPLLRREKASQLRIGFARPRDVLLTHNATVGRVAVMPDSAGEVILGTSVTYYRLRANYIDPFFCCIAMQGDFWQAQLRSVMEQTTRNQVSITKQVEFSLVVPPLNEQQEITQRVEALFKIADAVDERVSRASVRAFQGYEPANALEWNACECERKSMSQLVSPYGTFKLHQYKTEHDFERAVVTQVTDILGERRTIP
jgi:type I restriction enzyme S subunit